MTRHRSAPPLCACSSGAQPRLATAAVPRPATNWMSVTGWQIDRYRLMGPPNITVQYFPRLVLRHASLWKLQGGYRLAFPHMYVRDLQLLLYTVRLTDFVLLFGRCSSSMNGTNLGRCVIRRASVQATDTCKASYSSADILKSHDKITCLEGEQFPLKVRYVSKCHYHYLNS